ncbi:MAG: hypothetical protein R3C56_25515 [Pirellulaceae bacterium]
MPPAVTDAAEITGHIAYQAWRAALSLKNQRALANIRKLQNQLVGLKRNCEMLNSFVEDNLNTQWRSLKATFVAMKDYRKMLQANIDETGIYRDHISQGSVEQLGQIADLLLRAEERRTRSASQYFGAVGEYRKVHYRHPPVVRIIGNSGC